VILDTISQFSEHSRYYSNLYHTQALYEEIIEPFGRTLLLIDNETEERAKDRELYIQDIGVCCKNLMIPRVCLFLNANNPILIAISDLVDLINVKIGRINLDFSLNVCVALLIRLSQKIKKTIQIGQKTHEIGQDEFLECICATYISPDTYDLHYIKKCSIDYPDESIASKLAELWNKIHNLFQDRLLECVDWGNILSYEMVRHMNTKELMKNFLKYLYHDESSCFINLNYVYEQMETEFDLLIKEIINTNPNTLVLTKVSIKFSNCNLKVFNYKIALPERLLRAYDSFCTKLESMFSTQKNNQGIFWIYHIYSVSIRISVVVTHENKYYFLEFNGKSSMSFVDIVQVDPICN
jgi:hypothetical protein